MLQRREKKSRFENLGKRLQKNLFFVFFFFLFLGFKKKKKKKIFPILYGGFFHKFCLVYFFSLFFLIEKKKKIFFHTPQTVGFFHQFWLFYHFFLILSNWKKERKVWLIGVTQNLCVTLPGPKKHEKSFQSKKSSFFL